ncbi:Hint domain-containing protein [Vineibacter terrae]|uniref:Hint domain-containing protein n=1 Tax=Vineibacter terrae TaxID=2586908 RepID=UPI002E311BB4|nr:Hint domain-containing protein [Vineibacter terrae]HEX2885966.1 Hint domain-containing protein [Vineibacter terrae]
MATSLLGTPADDKLSGTNGDDDISGGPGDDLIQGGAGDDVLRGGSGDDDIRGGAGDDVISGGAGDDDLRGGAGDDVIAGGGGDDDLRGGAGDDVIRGGAGDDVVAGGAGDDVIIGGAGDDVVAGGAGDDVIRGGAGDDIVAGDAGDDVLFGGAGDDVIRGGAGDDVIDGGTGDDVMSGGAGADVFRNAGSFGSDVILDFDKTTDRLDLRAFTSYELTQAGDDTIVTVAGGQITLRGVTPEGLESAIDIACVVRGTLIRTPAGEVPVETLAAGDMVVTIDGTAKPVKWIGRRSYGSAFIRSNSKVAPIRILAGTLGTASPAADLLVSPEHAVHVDGALIPARLLVNGGTIRQVTDIESLEYFHVELEAPDVLWTNGAPTESYVNHGNRRMFSNWAEYVGRYGSEDEAPRDTDGEYVRRFRVVYGGAALQAVRDRLAGMPLTTAA